MLWLGLQVSVEQKAWCYISCLWMKSRPGHNFIKPVSIETCYAQTKYCLTETDYQPKCHKIYVVETRAPLSLWLAEKFAKQCCLLIILGPDVWQESQKYFATAENSQPFFPRLQSTKTSLEWTKLTDQWQSVSAGRSWTILMGWQTPKIKTHRPSTSTESSLEWVRWG